VSELYAVVIDDLNQARGEPLALTPLLRKKLNGRYWIEDRHFGTMPRGLDLASLGYLEGLHDGLTDGKDLATVNLLILMLKKRGRVKLYVADPLEKMGEK
jgi:hypothetical protein